MKIVVFLFLIFSAVHADEMQRLESIVKDIEQLRVDYELSQTKLKTCEMNLAAQQEGLASSEIYIEKIKSLENQIKELQKTIRLSSAKSVKIKDNPIISLNNKIINEKCIEKKENIFPVLKMREKQEKDTSAATYRLTQESIIYSGIDGKEIDKWENLRSFTSTLRIGGWIKISGYFVNREWQKAHKQMWVKASNALKRD